MGKTICSRTAWTLCQHCDDRFIVWVCGKCSRIVARMCRECHNELEHGIMPPVIHSLLQGIKRERSSKDDESGIWDNAVRVLEGG